MFHWLLERYRNFRIRRVVGMTPADAVAYVQQKGYRVYVEQDSCKAATYIENCANLRCEDGKVVEIMYWG